MPNTKTGTTWAPDIRPESIETFTETYTPEGGEQQTVEYKAVNHHPILNQILDKLAFFRTHAGAVWYNLAERKTLLTKLNELDAELREVNAKMPSFQVETGTVKVTAKSRSANIIFQKEFTSSPIVLLTNNYNNRNTIIWSVSGVKKSGFSAYVYDVTASGASEYDTYANWLAISL